MKCGRSKMPCESCAVQFSVFRRKRSCLECDRYYCSSCLRRGGGLMCAPCRLLSTRPLSRQSVIHLKVRDLQCFLHRQNISTRACVEKEDLISLVISHVNSGSYRRHAPRVSSSSGAFSTFKGITSNINELLNSAFDLRNTNAQHTGAQHYNNSDSPPVSPTHTGAWASSVTTPNPQTPRRQFRSERVHNDGTRSRSPPHIQVTEPASAPAPSDDIESPERVDTADCFEIEDLDDSNDWEFVNRPADPLPNDSNILLTENEDSPGAHLRAASELDLRSSESNETVTDTSSLKEEPIDEKAGRSDMRVDLANLREASELEMLTAKQLKVLLAMNRVDYRGCVERAELLERARRLWRENAKYKNDVESLPLDECCKICMAAPLECVLLECGHIAACTHCAKQLAECPICRQYVIRAVRFFRS